MAAKARLGTSQSLRPSRRRFLKTAAGAAAVSAAALTFPIRRVYGANETVNLGFIGVGDRGSYSVEWYSKLPDIRVATLCDADPGYKLGKAHEKHAQAKTETDLRRVLDDKSIDAVVISTCNHWHALAAVWAIQAGKDVYVEKPISNNVWEGRKIVEAARKYNKIVQGGTQQRSDPVQAEIRDFIKSGKLGKVQWIRGNRYGYREGIGKRAEPLKPPATCNYEMWLGPAQDLPIYRDKLHYDWHWVWNTGAGELGNWGVHIMDDIRNMLFDRCTLPPRLLSGGGRVVWNDAGETANVQFVYFDTGPETGNIPVLFSLSNLPRKFGEQKTATNYRNIQSGYVIQFEHGYYAGGRGGGRAFDSGGKQIQSFKGDGGGEHARNFIDAVKSRKRESLNAEIEVTHYSSSWCHLANAAYRLGSGYSREKAESIAQSSAPWKELLDNFQHHLEANHVDLAQAGLKVSSILEVDPKRETFTGASATPDALALLRREYRKPYVMPEQV
jgi:predicted dehydrogenase